MSVYDVYVFCDKCGQPHSVNLKLTLDDPDLNQASLSDLYAGKELPSSITFMQSNKYRCPHTKQLFPADDLEKAILYFKEENN